MAVKLELQVRHRTIHAQLHPAMEASHFAADAYHEEQVLLLNIESSQEFLKDQSSVQIRVQKLEQPWTLSCGMVAVLIHSADGESNIAFLKLFDRRWAHQLRSDKGIPPWTAQLEAAYAEFLQSGEAAAAFFSRLDKKIKKISLWMQKMTGPTARMKLFLHTSCGR